MAAPSAPHLSWTEPQREQWQQLGYHHFDQCLTAEQRAPLVQSLWEQQRTGKLQLESIIDAAMYGNSYGVGRLPAMENLLQQWTPLLQQLLQLPELRPANTYARIYYHGSTLKPHTDRPGLDYTMSVCLASTLTQPWPLQATDNYGQTVQANLLPGAGLLLHSAQLVHWRDSLVCGPSQYAMQMFLHWTTGTTAAATTSSL